MFSRAGLVFLVLAVLNPELSHSQADSYDWKSWGSVTDTLTASTPGERLVLNSPFIVSGSESVQVDGLALHRGEYEFNYQQGTIRILTPIREGARVRVSYTRLPFFVNSMYSLRNVEFADVRRPVAELPAPRKREGYFNPTGDLVFGGMKSISLSFGSSQGTSLDQTLRATVEGHLTSSITVKALLSDNNLPIQPEGNTQELQYLDKVYVEIGGTNGRATLGDFTFKNEYSDFTPVSRELKGVSGELFNQGSRVGAAAGSSKGVFRTVNFRGVEQLQGPYELLTPGRVTGEVIIAGTEKVYFDGDQLQRGQNRDYTIDYDNGTITFTPRRLVTTDTEIAVDFEVTQEQYERTSTFGTGETAILPGQFKVEALVAREEDDSHRPKSTAISEADRGLIADAGDNPDAAIAKGATFVGVGEGNYELVPADSMAGVPEHYVFNDSTGAYDVIFVEVGGGKGDYLLDGITANGLPRYRFAGVGAGIYLVGRRLPLPQSHTVVSTRLAREGRLNLDAQYNISDFDKNTLSRLDDGDNVGDAGEFRIGLRALPVGIGELDLRGTVSTVEDNFRSLEKTRDWYFYKDWNLERDPLVGREVIESLASTFRRGKALQLDYDLGHIHRDNFDGIKHDGKATLKAGDDRRLAGRVLDTDLDGDNEKRTRKLGSVSVDYGVWKLLPSAQFASEEYFASSPVLPDSGIAYSRYGARLAKRHVDRFGYSFEAEERNTEQRADTTNGWIDTRTDRTYRAGFELRRTRVVQGQLEFSHKQQVNKLLGGTLSSDLARLKGQFRGESIGLNGNVDYEISQNQLRTQQKSVLFVGEGQGDYNALGEPVGKGRGDYTVVFLPTQETIPTSRVNFVFRFAWKAPASLSTGLWSWIERNVSLNQQLTVREESVSEDPFRVYLLFPSALQNDDTTIRGIVSLLQEWSLLGGYPGLGLTFRYQRDDQEDNSFAGVNENKFFQQQIVRVDRSVSEALSANVEGTRELNKRYGKGIPTGTGSTYDVTAWGLAGGLGLRFSAGSSLDIRLEGRLQDDAESGAQERSIAFKPRFVWRIGKIVNVFGRYELTHFSGVDETAVRPFFFTTPGTTHRWALTPTIRMSKFISIVSTYEGRSEDTFSGNRVTEHDFRIETRAFF